MRSLSILLIAVLALVSIVMRLTSVADRSTTIAGLLTETDPPIGFAYATFPRSFDFPKDHASHPRYRSEWWYFTGNTGSEAGRSFGFQLTLFRFALTPSPSTSQSQWRRSNVYLGHFAVSDIDAGLFHNFERQSRPALALAGTQTDPTKIWLRDWVIELIDVDQEIWHLTARESGVAVDLVLSALRPVTLQGEGGLSKKNEQPGNASYYYSIARLGVAGTIETPRGTHTVTGNAWYDHEWSTSALAEGQLGWDWFSLQLDDGRELMFYQIRTTTGEADRASHGILLSADGTQAALRPDDVRVNVKRHWRSPTSGTRYPAAWQISIPSHDLELDVTPRMPHQEWDKNFIYWEGAVQLNGVADGAAVSGTGYVELVGYD